MSAELHVFRTICTMLLIMRQFTTLRFRVLVCRRKGLLFSHRRFKRVKLLLRIGSVVALRSVHLNILIRVVSLVDEPVIVCSIMVHRWVVGHCLIG